MINPFLDSTAWVQCFLSMNRIYSVYSIIVRYNSKVSSQARCSLALTSKWNNLSRKFIRTYTPIISKNLHTIPTNPSNKSTPETSHPTPLNLHNNTNILPIAQISVKKVDPTSLGMKFWSNLGKNTKYWGTSPSRKVSMFPSNRYNKSILSMKNKVPNSPAQ